MLYCSFSSWIKYCKIKTTKTVNFPKTIVVPLQHTSTHNPVTPSHPLGKTLKIIQWGGGGGGKSVDAFSTWLNYELSRSRIHNDQFINAELSSSLIHVLIWLMLSYQARSLHNVCVCLCLKLSAHSVKLWGSHINISQSWEWEVCVFIDRTCSYCHWPHPDPNHNCTEKRKCQKVAAIGNATMNLFILQSVIVVIVTQPALLNIA